MQELYESIILGAGPAGITASIYAARKGMKCLVISSDIGGQAAWSGDVENYTGYQMITGAALIGKFEDHAQRYSVTIREGETVTALTQNRHLFSLESNKGRYKAKTVIIATGKRSKELDVPGEKEFHNKGVTYCATCDGPLFKGNTVAVIGGGNSALDAALQLRAIARHVFLIEQSGTLHGDEVMKKKLRDSENVTVYTESRIEEIRGDASGSRVGSLAVSRRGERKRLDVEGIFIEIGLVPNSGFTTGIKKNADGEIEVNCKNETNVPGVFAAGDVTDVPEKQIIIAAGEGAKAVLSAYRYLNHKDVHFWD